jgi:flagellar motor switch protein FliG
MSATTPDKAAASMPGIRKAAILLILLGEEASAGVIRSLAESEVQQVSREIARIDSLSSEQAEAILEEFCQMSMGHEFVVRGGLDYAKKMLKSAFGADAGKKIADRLVLMIGGEYEHLDVLQNADPQQLARFIHNEHPQTIALVLSHLNAPAAASLLASLPADLRPEVALRMANLDQITPEIVNKIAKVIGEKLQVIGQFSRESYGGVRAVSELFNQLDSGISKDILDMIETQNPNLVETIRQLMFVFEDLLSLDITQLKEVLARVDRKILTCALKGTSAKLKEHFFSTMSARGVDMLKDDIEALGPVKIRDVEGAQQQIIAIVRQLEGEGVISLKGGGSEQYVV